MPTLESPFLLGMNYWPRRKAMYWWKEFDGGEVDEEFAQMAEWGAQLVRFFLLWEDFQPEPEHVDGAQLRNLVTVLDSAQKHGLLANPTLLVGNMSGVMWVPAWAYTDRSEAGTTLQRTNGRYIHKQVRSPFSDTGMLRAEAVLAREAAYAVAGHPALHSWDLANEIDQMYTPANPDAGWLWAWAVSQALRADDPGVRVTYGAHDLSLTTRGLTMPALAPSLDYLAMHGYPIYSDVARDPLDIEFVPFITVLTAQLGDKPALMQEFGLPTAPPGEPSHTIQDDFLGTEKSQFLASEDDAGRYYAAVLDRLWEVGAMGAVAWIYADYAHELWSKPPLDRAVRERTFGLFRSDGTPKPSAEAFRRFADELHSGALAQRLGPHGSKRPHLDTDPVEYYAEPRLAFKRAYGAYLAAIEAS